MKCGRNSILKRVNQHRGSNLNFQLNLVRNKRAMLISFIYYMMAHCDSSKIFIHKYPLVADGSPECQVNGFWVWLIDPYRRTQVAVWEILFLPCSINIRLLALLRHTYISIEWIQHTRGRKNTKDWAYCIKISGAAKKWIIILEPLFSWYSNYPSSRIVMFSWIFWTSRDQNKKGTVVTLNIRPKPTQPFPMNWRPAM